MAEKIELPPKVKLELKKLRLHVKELKIRFVDIEAHLGEVAAASRTMTDIEGSVGILIERANRTPEELKAFTSRLEHLDKRLEMAFEQVPEMHDRLGDMECSLNSIVDRANQETEKPEAILSQLQQIETRLAGLAFDKLEERLSDTERSLCTLVQGASETPRTLSSVLSHLEHIDQRLEMTPEVISEELDEHFGSVNTWFGGILADNQLPERLMTLLSQMEQIENALTRMSGLAFDGLAERMDDIECSLSSLVDRANQETEKPEAILSQLQQIETRLAGLAFDKLEERLSDTERSLCTLVQGASETPRTLSSVLSHLEHIDQRLEMTPEVISEELDEHFGSVNTWFGGILADNQLPERLMTLLSQMEQIETRLTRMSGLAFDGLAERMDDIECSLSSLVERADQTPDGLAAIESRLEDLESSLSMRSEATTEEFEEQIGTAWTRLNEDTESEQHRPVLISEGQTSGITTSGSQGATEDPYQTFSDPDDGGLGSFYPDGPQLPSGSMPDDTAVTATSYLEDQATPQPSHKLDEVDLQETPAMAKATDNESSPAEIDLSGSELDPNPDTDATSSPTKSVEEELHGRWFKKLTVSRKMTVDTSDANPARNSKDNNEADKEMIELVLAGPAKQFRRENLREPANWIGTCRFESDPEEYIRECCVLDISPVGARLEFSDTPLEEIADGQIIFSNHLRGEIRHTELDDFGMVIVGVEFLNLAQDDELAREAQIYIQSLTRVPAGSTG